MGESLTLKIESCLDCPRFEKYPVKHWLAGNERLYRYFCNKANRDIYPADGIEPPPMWCPIRAAAQQSAQTNCVYPNDEGGMYVGKHDFGKDGFCIFCGQVEKK